MLWRMREPVNESRRVGGILREFLTKNPDYTNNAVLRDGEGYGARLGGRESEEPTRPSRAYEALAEIIFRSS